MAESSPILIIGGTQGTGYEAAKLLLNEGSRVRLFARNSEKARDLFGESVEIVVGDLRKAGSMREAVLGVEGIIFTAGVTKRPCGEDLIIQTEFEGLRKTIASAKESGFEGKILFLSSIGVTEENWASRLLNAIKGNALKWRRAMEDEIRQSGFKYVIVRAGFLVNGANPDGNVELSQYEYPLQLKYRIGRKEVAEIFLEALKIDAADGKTFDAVRSCTATDGTLPEQIERLRVDQ